MNKAFIRETDDEEDEGAEQAPSLPQGTRNYITPGGYARIKDELDQLLRVERPHIVEVVHWPPRTATVPRTVITSTARSACARSTGASVS